MEEILEEAGLSQNEARVYLKLSQIGMSSAYKISQESKVFKANTYDAIKRLENKGLVSKKIVQGRVMYEASDPSFLIDLIDVKKNRVNEILPALRMMQKSSSIESVFHSYKGVDSFVSILHRFLDYKEPILVYGAPKVAYEMMKYRIGNFHKERIKKKIKMFHIYNFEALERMKQLKKMRFTPVRSLPELFDSQVSTNICGDEVVFVIWKPPVKVLQIRDKDMACAYKNYFRLLWNNAKKA